MNEKKTTILVDYKNRENNLKNLMDRFVNLIKDDCPEDRDYIAPDIDLSYNDIDLIVISLYRSIQFEHYNGERMKHNEERFKREYKCRWEHE